MPTPTYDLIATTTLAANTSSVVFGSIPQGYRDLIIVGNTFTSTGEVGVQFNGDTGSNYSTVLMRGGASSTVSSVAFTDTAIWPSTQVGSPTGVPNSWTVQVMDYLATDKQKMSLTRFGSAASHVQAQANRWASTAAITSITFVGATYNANSTFSLYGVIA
jgi:hypothetical protein